MYLPEAHRDRAVLDAYLGWLDTDPGRRWYARFFAQYPVRPVPGLAEGLGRIGVPSAVIWGDRDGWCPPGIAEELARGIPEAELSWIPGAGHFVMEERPAEVLAALNRLLEADVRSPSLTNDPR